MGKGGKETLGRRELGTTHSKAKEVKKKRIYGEDLNRIIQLGYAKQNKFCCHFKKALQILMLSEIKFCSCSLFQLQVIDPKLRGWKGRQMKQDIFLDNCSGLIQAIFLYLTV